MESKKLMTEEEGLEQRLLLFMPLGQARPGTRRTDIARTGQGQLCVPDLDSTEPAG
jgi:hypothetical protein